MNDRHSMAPVTRNPPQIGSSQRIRLLVADDHALLRQAFRVLLESQDGLEVVGEATNGRDAVDVAERLMPDVVLMDMAPTPRLRHAPPTAAPSRRASLPSTAPVVRQRRARWGGAPSSWERLRPDRLGRECEGRRSSQLAPLFLNPSRVGRGRGRPDRG